MLFTFDDFINFTEQDLINSGISTDVIFREKLKYKKQSATQEVMVFERSILDRFTKNKSKEEIASWTAKADAARAFIALNPTPSQEKNILREVTALGGDDVASTAIALSEKIIAKADIYEQIIYAISGFKSKLFKGIEAAQSAEEIDTLMAASKQQAEAMLNDILIGGA